MAIRESRKQATPSWPRQAKIAARLTPNATAATATGARTLVPLEQPAEVARLVTDFWAGSGDRSRSTRKARSQFAKGSLNVTLPRALPPQTGGEARPGNCDECRR